MNTKHTPGPWHVHIDNTLIVQNKVGQCIAETGQNVYIENEQHKANAQLIAAAPELLEACQQAIKVISEIADIGQQNRAGWAHKALQSAIDKAQNQSTLKAT